ncbi:hypothetical protein PFISCL1PPCAC_24756, partial [Pristionchus fissidentatus]
EARFTLRERYLKMMNLVCSKPVEVELDDKAVVTGVLEAVKPDGSHLLLSKMKTPIGVHEHAVLRSSDVILMRTSVSDL